MILIQEVLYNKVQSTRVLLYIRTYYKIVYTVCQEKNEDVIDTKKPRIFSAIKQIVTKYLTGEREEVNIKPTI